MTKVGSNFAEACCSARAHLVDGFRPPTVREWISRPESTIRPTTGSDAAFALGK